MNVELIIQDSNSGKIYDITNLVKNINWETTLQGQPGKLTFDYIKTEKVFFSEGSPLTFKVNGTGVFYGFVFKNSITEKGKISVTAYDQLRYLKNSDTYVIKNMTASGIFEKLCKDYQLKYRVVHPSSYVIASRVFDNKTLFDIIQTALNETLAYTSNRFAIRDNFGILEFVDLSKLKTNLFVGDESLLYSYTCDSSIDSDTYNQVKLIRENEDIGKRELYIVKDSSSIKKWGLLQYFEKMDKDANAAQISDRAQKLLALKNRPTKSLKLNCLGDLRVFAGCGIVVGIENLKNEGFGDPKYYVVTQCTHKFKNCQHTMELEVEASI